MAWLGDGAPLSKTSIQRLRGDWKREHEAWSRRSLEGPEGISHHIRLESPYRYMGGFGAGGVQIIRSYDVCEAFVSLATS